MVLKKVNQAVKTTIVSIFFLFLILFFLSAQNAASKESASKTPVPEQKKISGTGCVMPGAENQCIILKTIKGVTYNLIFKNGKKPDFNTMISFEGKKFNGVSICMEGIPVTVTKWTILKMKCPETSDDSAAKKISVKSEKGSVSK